MDTEGLQHLLTHVQDGVVSRRQLLALGATPNDVRRLARRRELTRVHPGVFVNHTGPLTWAQRAWAAVLVHWPAALAGESALPLPRSGGPIHVAIDVRRTVRSVPGVVAHRVSDLDTRVAWLQCPPRLVVEHAVIDVASSATDLLDAFHVLADVCQTRRASASTIASTLRGRPRVRRRKILLELLDDLATGACSVLEREYLRAVERAHGLPRGQRQPVGRTGGRKTYRDVLYRGFGVVVELDGRAFHDNARARDRDAERDLDAVADAETLTVRLTYGLVFRSPCRTADRIGRLLRRRGWRGKPSRCPHCPDS